MPHFAWYTGLPTKDETSQVTIYRMHTVCFFIFIQLQTIVSFFVKSLNKSPKDCIKMWSNLGIVISKKFSFVYTVSFFVNWSLQLQNQTLFASQNPILRIYLYSSQFVSANESVCVCVCRVRRRANIWIEPFFTFLTFFSENTWTRYLQWSQLVGYRTRDIKISVELGEKTYYC